MRSESIEFGYDSAGLLTKKEISSKLGIEAITAYEYDKNGNLKKKVNFYGIHISSINVVTEEKESGGTEK